MQLPPDHDRPTIEVGIAALFREILLDAIPEGVEARRWLRGRRYQSALRVTRLQHAWPEPNESQQQSIAHALIWDEVVEKELLRATVEADEVESDVEVEVEVEVDG